MQSDVQVQLAVEGVRTMLDVLGFLVVVIGSIGVWFLKNLNTSVRQIGNDVSMLKADVTWLKRLRDAS